MSFTILYLKPLFILREENTAIKPPLCTVALKKNNSTAEADAHITHVQTGFNKQNYLTSKIGNSKENHLKEFWQSKGKLINECLYPSLEFNICKVNGAIHLISFHTQEKSS